MTRRRFALLAILAPWGGAATTAEADGPEPRPNIIVILADDLGWADIGYHDSDVRTPVLDRLAAEGVRLERHYVYPTCSPTRVALLSGRFPSRFGVLSPLGFANRHTFYIGADGRILAIDRDVKPETSAQDMAAKLKELGVAER